MRFLTYNVFPGSPWPYVGGGISALAPNRLRQQVKAVEALSCEVIFFQELYCKYAIKAYSNNRNLIAPGMNQPHVFGFACYLAYLGLLAGIPSFLFSPFWAVFIISLTAIAWFLRFCSLRGWLTGNTSGLAISLDPAYPINDVYWKLFDRQDGDILNTFSPRGYMMVSTTINQIDVMLFNLHLDRNPSEARLAQLEEVLDEIAKVINDASLFVMAGDFNASIDSPEVSMLINKGFRHHKGSGNTWCITNHLTHTMYSSGTPDGMIDHIFTLGRHTITGDSDVVLHDPPLSDHYGLMLSS